MYPRHEMLRNEVVFLTELLGILDRFTGADEALGQIKNNFVLRPLTSASWNTPSERVWS